MGDLYPKSYPIGKFDGTNFPVWKAKFEAYLEAIDKMAVLVNKQPRNKLLGTIEEIKEREESIEY